GYTVGSVARGIGENVVELVRDHATQGAAENGLAVLRIGPEKISLHKAANAVTIHVGEWQDGSVAHMSPAQGAGNGVARHRAIDIATSFECQDGQFDRNFVASDPRECAPLEL